MTSSNQMSVNRETSLISSSATGNAEQKSSSHLSPVPEDLIREDSGESAPMAFTIDFDSECPKPTPTISYPDHLEKGVPCLDMGRSHKTNERTMQSLIELGKERENIRDLAAFLKSSEPPSNNNYTTVVPSKDAQAPTKKSTFTFFRRHNSKSNLPEGQRSSLLLIDKAVAATTIDGHRHLHISIPKVVDQIEDIPPLQYPKSRQQPYNGSKSSRRMATVTVHKPQNHARDLTSPCSAVIQSHRDLSNALQFGSPRSSGDSSHFGTSLLAKFPKPILGERHGPQEPFNSAWSHFSPVIGRHDSQRSDPRHSGGTIYSEQTLPTTAGHSREASNVSTVPNFPPNALRVQQIEVDNFPKRSSSRAKTRVSSSTEHTVAGPSKPNRRMPPSPEAPVVPAKDFLSRQTSTTSSETKGQTSLQRSSLLSTSSKTDSIVSDVSSTLIASCREMSTETINTDPHISTRNSPPPGPAPTRRLPDLPESSDESGIPSPLRRHHTTKSSSSTASSTASSTTFSPLTTVQVATIALGQKSRKERVTARKQRDIAKIRESLSLNPPRNHRSCPRDENNSPIRLSGQPSQTARIFEANSPPRHARRNSPTFSPSPKERLHRRIPNVISPVMLVADLQPGDLDMDISPSAEAMAHSSNRRKSRATHTPRPSVSGTHTPPRSPSPSTASSDDEAVHDPAMIGTPTRRERPSSEVREARQKRRSEQRKKAEVREKELDDRLERIERKNRDMIDALDKLSMAVMGVVGLKAEESRTAVGQRDYRDMLVPVMQELTAGA